MRALALTLTVLALLALVAAIFGAVTHSAMSQTLSGIL